MILPKSFFSLVNHFGLLVSASSVRLVELNRDNSIKTQASAVSPEPIIAGDAVNEKLLAQLVTQVRDQAQCRANFAVVCIPEKVAYSREQSLPKISLSEVVEAINWQIGSIFPFSPNDIYYDWKLISQSPDTTKVVVVAVSKKIVDGIIRALDSINVRPLSFEPSASILSRALSSMVSEDHIVLEIDSFGTSATLIQNKIAMLTTTTHFQADTNPQQIFDNIAASVTNIINHAYKQTQPENLKLYITGEKASGQIEQLLSQKLNFPISLLPIEHVEPAYHIPYAAALSAVLPPESEQSINVLPKELQSEYQLEVESIQAKKTFLFGMIPATIAFVIALALFGLTNVQSRLLKPSVIPPLPAAASQVNIPLILQKAQKITNPRYSKQTPDKAITSIIAAQDESVHIKHIGVDLAKKTILVTVEGADRAAFMNYKTVLESSNLFSGVTVPLAALAAESRQDAQITLTIKDQPLP